MQIKNIFHVAIGTLLVLLVPLALTLFEVAGFHWTPIDFIVMGILLFVAGSTLSFVIRKFSNPAHRTIAIALVALAFLLIWIDLAVGLFNIPGISGS